MRGMHAVGLVSPDETAAGNARVKSMTATTTAELRMPMIVNPGPEF
jgi:hypothetical protein